MDLEELKTRFTYHAPDDDKISRHAAIRKQGLQLAMTFDQLAPESREKELAMAKLEEAVMWLNAAIARRIEPRHEGSFD